MLTFQERPGDCFELVRTRIRRGGLRIRSSGPDYLLSSLSNRMNEIMKVLTIIAMIVMPLTFIAGVYGMNFNSQVSPWNMPELKWRYGYILSLLLMALSALGMLACFRRKGWLGEGDENGFRSDGKQGTAFDEH